jgi:putative ABC transport system substrate-binding protein
MNRRARITFIGGAAVAWLLAARAQQPAMPVIGYLNLGSPESDVSRLSGLPRGWTKPVTLKAGIEYRWAGNQANRLPAHARANLRLVNSSSQSLDSHHRPVAERPVGLVPS